MITVPFHEMIDTDSEIWRLINRDLYPSLYPPNVLDDEIIENINIYFYDRQIAYSSPQRFVMQWWRLIKERAYAWTKLLQTEHVLRDEDMLYNYDLNENSTDTRTGEGSSSTKNKPDLKIKTTPDLLTTENTDSTQKNTMSGTSNGNGTTTDSTNTENRRMDTPDGITSDINNYVTQAEKGTESNTTTNNNQNRTNQSNDNSNRGKVITRQVGDTWQYRFGEDNTESQTNSTDTNTHELRRYGNIGVMTAAQILGGYREAQQYDIYQNVIFPECEQLFLHFVDLDEVDIW